MSIESKESFNPSILYKIVGAVGERANLRFCNLILLSDEKIEELDRNAITYGTDDIPEHVNREIFEKVWGALVKHPRPNYHIVSPHFDLDFDLSTLAPDENELRVIQFVKTKQGERFCVGFDFSYPWRLYVTAGNLYFKVNIKDRTVQLERDKGCYAVLPNCFTLLIPIFAAKYDVKNKKIGEMLPITSQLNYMIQMPLMDLPKLNKYVPEDYRLDDVEFASPSFVKEFENYFKRCVDKLEQQIKAQFEENLRQHEKRKSQKSEPNVTHKKSKDEIVNKNVEAPKQNDNVENEKDKDKDSEKKINMAKYILNNATGFTGDQEDYGSDEYFNDSWVQRLLKTKDDVLDDNDYSSWNSGDC
jgi:hypothetical protein